MAVDLTTGKVERTREVREETESDTEEGVGIYFHIQYLVIA